MPLPRFQFRLRTLLIGVALLSVPCAYVGWQAKIVAQRKAWLKAKAANDTEFIAFRSGLISEGDRAEGPLLIRRLLGDSLQEEVVLLDNADSESAAALFPEADIYSILNSGMSDMDPKHPQGFGGGGTF